MKKCAIIIVSALVALATLFAACSAKQPPDPHKIEVSWSEGVEGVVFIQDGDRLLPKNGEISTYSDEDISISVDLKDGYRQTAPVIKADGEISASATVPASVDSVEISAVPNSDISLLLGEGVGYKINELKRTENEVGFTSLVGVCLDEGYRVNSATKINLIVAGAKYQAVSSLAEWGLNEVELKAQGYHSFYRVEVLENTAIGVTGVVADTHSAEDYATVTHTGGEGYTLRALIDNNNDGISDTEQVLSGKSVFLKGTVLNLVIRRDSDYTAANAKLYANGAEIYGTQGDGADDSDPLSDLLIYPVTVSGDIEFTVTGVKKIGQFTLHIMNSDGVQRYRTFCRADSVDDALKQIPGNDDRQNEAYSRWWEPYPGDGYTFKIWRFTEHIFKEEKESYAPSLYEDIYCGYIKDGETPTDPCDRPTVPQEPEKPSIPDSTDIPKTLKSALDAVANLGTNDRQSKQWVLAWATYQLYKVGAADLGRPSVFPNANIYDDWYDDILTDYKGPAANNLWIYAYDMLKNGASEISVENQLLSSFINPNNGSKRNWANNEAIVLEIIQEYVPQFVPKTSFTVTGTDDLNMTISLILDGLGVEWTLSGNYVKDYTVESYREYVRQNASGQVMANAVNEVYAYIDSLGV